MRDKNRKNIFNLFTKDVKIPFPALILYVLIVVVLNSIIFFYFHSVDRYIFDLVFLPLSFFLFGLFISDFKDNKEFFGAGNNKKIFIRSVFIAAVVFFLIQLMIYFFFIA